jgi:hypothetical protein
MVGALIHAEEDFREHRALIEERGVALDAYINKVEPGIDPEEAKQIFNDGARAIIELLAYNGYFMEAQALSIDCNDAAWSGESVKSVRKLALQGLYKIDPILHGFWTRTDTL